MRTVEHVSGCRAWRWRPALSLVLLVVIVLTAVGCSDRALDAGEPPSAEASVLRMLLVSSEIDVAAVEVRGVVNPEALAFVGAWLPHENALAWPHVGEDGAFTLGLITTTAIRGGLVGLVFEELAAGAAPERVTLVAFDDAGAVLPNGSLNAAWITREVAALHEPERAVASLDADLAKQGAQVHAYR